MIDSNKLCMSSSRGVPTAELGELAACLGVCLPWIFLFEPLIGIRSLLAPSRVTLASTRQSTTPVNRSGYTLVNVDGSEGNLLTVTVPSLRARSILNSDTKSSSNSRAWVGVTVMLEAAMIVERPMR